MVRIIPAEKVTPTSHSSGSQLKQESIDALAAARDNVGAWVVWQSDFPHHKASKVQAYNLRNGQRQKTLTDGLLEPDGDERLEFKAWAEDGKYYVLARFTTAEFRIHERENGQAS